MPGRETEQDERPRDPRGAERDEEADTVDDDTQRAAVPSPAALSARLSAAAVRDAAAGTMPDARRRDGGGTPDGSTSAAATSAAATSGEAMQGDGTVAGGLTGDTAVDEALRSLDGLTERPLPAHVAAFDAVHGALQDRLAEAQG